MTSEDIKHQLIIVSLVTQSVTACYWLAEHICEQRQASYRKRVAQQESKLLIWLRLSARVVNRDKDLTATTDAHHRPVRVHKQRSGKGLQAKQSEILRAQDSAIQKPDQNRNNMSQFIQSPLCIKPYSIKKEKDRKEKVIWSWPGTCIQYTRLQYKISTINLCIHCAPINY